MKLKTTCYFLSLVLLWGCRREGVCISGTINNCNTSYLLLMQILPDEVVDVDTVLLLNEKFSHHIKSQQVGVYLLKISDDVFLSFIANSGDKLVFWGDAEDNLLQNYDVQGNEETKLVIESRRKLDEVYQQTKQLSDEFVRHTYNENFDSLKVIDSVYIAIFDAHKNYLTHFIRSNPDKLASLMAFYQTLGQNAFFSVENDRELLEMMYLSLSKTYPNSVYVNHLKEKLEEE